MNSDLLIEIITKGELKNKTSKKDKACLAIDGDLSSNRDKKRHKDYKCQTCSSNIDEILLKLKK